MSNFDSTKIALSDIIRQVVEGKVQLPDFQRGWVWDDNHVRSLLVSIARSFPVGAVMLLETGGDVRFQVRPVENLEFEGTIPEPEKLILDGQQRLTSLTQVLALQKPVRTFDEKRKPISRYYYIDIHAALDGILSEDAVIAVEATKKVMTNFGRDVALDLSTPQLECEHFHFPCSQILNSNEWEKHLYKYAPNKFPAYMEFRDKVLGAFRGYQLPVISLGKATSKEAVCLVFEKVNTGGVPLSVFELVTASFAADGFNLRDDWYGSARRDVEGRNARLRKEAILQTVEPTDYLQTISLLHTFERRQADLKAGKVGKAVSAVSAKRAAILNLALEDYQKWADEAEKGFMLAAKFLRKECFFSTNDLPYRTQIAPLAALMAKIKERWLEPKIYEKIAQWYWCGVMGELYGGAVETRIANDLEELVGWIEGGDTVPRTIYEADFNTSRLHTLRSRLSAAYKGVNVLVLRSNSKDFFWKASIKELDFEEIALDIHHIFPKIWCESRGIKPNVFNSIINKTPISYKANRMIGGAAPSKYLADIQKHKQVGLSDAEMDTLLATHYIPAESLRADDFQSFYDERQMLLMVLIEGAMGKAALQQKGNYEDFEEGLEDDEVLA